MLVWRCQGTGHDRPTASRTSPLKSYGLVRYFGIINRRQDRAMKKASRRRRLHLVGSISDDAHAPFQDGTSKTEPNALERQLGRINKDLNKINKGLSTVPDDQYKGASAWISLTARSTSRPVNQCQCQCHEGGVAGGGEAWRSFGIAVTKQIGERPFQNWRKLEVRGAITSCSRKPRQVLWELKKIQKE